MATTSELNTIGETIAFSVKDGENALNPAERDMEVIRPHTWRYIARGLATALDPAWQVVEPKTSSNPDAAKFGTGWLNKGAGWAGAEIRRVPLLSTVGMRGYIYTSAASNTLILTLPPSLRPAQNELFATVIDYQPALINVWVDGTVSVYFAEATTRQMVTLSGISWEGAV